MSDAHVPRRSNGIIGGNESVGQPKEEPWRNYAGWECSHCDSTNTIIESYNSGPEGYCMSCTREQPIPKEHLDAYNVSRSG